jgi:hypothetical protein
MASEKISQLTNGNPAQNGDLIPIARGGANFSVTPQSIAALAGSTVIGGAGAGFWGPGLDLYFGLDNATGAIALNEVAGVAQPAGTLICYQFVLPYDVEIQQVTTQSNDSTGTFLVQLGIYDSTGALVLNAREWAVNTTGQGGAGSGVTNILPAPVTLQAGTYWHVQSSTSGGSAIPHFNGWAFPAGGGEVINMTFWLKNFARAATAANLGATATTAVEITSTSQSGTSLTLMGSFSDPGASGKYLTLFDFGSGTFSNNGNYLCTASAANTLTVTNPNGVTAVSTAAFAVLPNANLPATLGTLTPVTPIATEGVVSPLYER